MNYIQETDWNLGAKYMRETDWLLVHQGDIIQFWLTRLI